MSKSYDNAIYMSDSPEDILAKVARMITDPQRARRNDPGNPDVCNVFEFHKLYSDKTTVNEINETCRKAEVGCVECKKIMAKNLAQALEPIREKRKYYESQPDLVTEIIKTGTDKARKTAQQTMKEVRSAMKMYL
jgi:tryptophanyl-tRNA synthetase